jgi:hypothetical protein
MLRPIMIIIISLSMTSCIEGALTMPKSWNWGWKPRPYMARGLPDGDDDYSKGFQAGCKSVLGMVAQGGVRMIRAEYDGWMLTSNSLYAKGFLDGEEHCTYIYDWDIT